MIQNFPGIRIRTGGNDYFVIVLGAEAMFLAENAKAQSILTA